MNPEQLLYAKSHEWVHVEEAGVKQVATVGISAFAVEALTDLVFIELPRTGRPVTPQESFCEIESVKAVSDIYAPVAGEVVQVNDKLADHLELFSDDPYGEGWICKIEITDPAGLKALMDYEAYQKMCAEEAQ
ncbi:Glycine cleavage system H protein [Pirellulimonas nuda]|uniref:Glycine cleavage system H protein n=1 Tax=Pirellulimonas nuda TaxID=2528009 RepID=A0A518D7P6_9BACT|nr:glycine cleavage system protein GcvH [Pirellulimonas nuda]QDU87494.1 Glycine cleavage system H protein [Pirellulimonas nuda]